MATELKLFINDTNGKVHIIEQRAETLCGALTQGPMSIHMFNQYKKDVFIPKDWCRKCLTDVVFMIIRNGQSRFLPILDYAMSRTPKQTRKKDESIDAIRLDLSFDDEEMTIRALAGKSIGARDSFSIKVKKEVTLGWDRLDELRNMTEEAEHVTIGFHTVQR